MYAGEIRLDRRLALIYQQVLYLDPGTEHGLVRPVHGLCWFSDAARATEMHWR